MEKRFFVFSVFLLLLVVSLSLTSADSSVDIKANNVDGPVTLSSGQSLYLSWTGTNVGGCRVYINDRDLTGVESPGSWPAFTQSHPFYPVKTEGTVYTLTCKELYLNPQVNAMSLSDVDVSDSVTVKLASTNQLDGTSTIRKMTVSLPSTTIVKTNTYLVRWELTQPLSMYSP